MLISMTDSLSKKHSAIPPSGGIFTIASNELSFEFETRDFSPENFRERSLIILECDWQIRLSLKFHRLHLSVCHPLNSMAFPPRGGEPSRVFARSCGYQSGGILMTRRLRPLFVTPWCIRRSPVA